MIFSTFLTCFLWNFRSVDFGWFEDCFVFLLMFAVNRVIAIIFSEKLIGDLCILRVGEFGGKLLCAQHVCHVCVYFISRTSHG